MSRSERRGAGDVRRVSAAAHPEVVLYFGLLHQNGAPKWCTKMVRLFRFGAPMPSQRGSWLTSRSTKMVRLFRFEGPAPSRAASDVTLDQNGASISFRGPPPLSGRL